MDDDLKNILIDGRRSIFITTDGRRLMPNWSGSTRRSTLPPDWHKLRAAVKARDKGKCQCPGCPKCAGAPCTTPGTDCDHIGARTLHALHNLRLLCGACHLYRTGRQGGTAPRKSRPSTRRKPERHPGLA